MAITESIALVFVLIHHPVGRPCSWAGVVRASIDVWQFDRSNANACTIDQVLLANNGVDGAVMTTELCTLTIF